MENIPSAIIQDSKELIELYGNKFTLLGIKDNVTYYHFVFPLDASVGYPVVYVVNAKGKISQLKPEEALSLSCLFGG